MCSCHICKGNIRHLIKYLLVGENNNVKGIAGSEEKMGFLHFSETVIPPISAPFYRIVNLDQVKSEAVSKNIRTSYIFKKHKF